MPPPSTQSGDGRTTLSNAFGRSDIKNFGITFGLDFDLGFANFITTTAYRDFKYGRSQDQDGTGAELGHSDTNSDFKVWSQDVRLQSASGGDFGWAVGLSFADESLNEERIFSFRDDPFSFTNFRFYGIANNRAQAIARLAYKQSTESLAAFAEASYKITPALELRGSLRYTDLEKKYTNGGFNFPNGTGTVLGIALPITNFQLLNSYELKANWTGNASLSYKLADDIMLYASLGRGTKEGGFSGGFPTQGADSIVAIGEEKVWSYEIGAKTRFMDGRTDRIRPYKAPTGTQREFALNETGGYTLLNGRVGWRAADESLSIAGFVRNITDKAYVASPVTDDTDSDFYM